MSVSRALPCSLGGGSGPRRLRDSIEGSLQQVTGEPLPDEPVELLAVAIHAADQAGRLVLPGISSSAADRQPRSTDRASGHGPSVEPEGKLLTMFEARNGITGDTITAEEFEHAADRQFIALRLTCLGCGADAMFRRQSIDGRKATFWAWHARPDCGYASGGAGETEFRALEEVEPRRPAEHLVKVRPAQRGGPAAMGSRLEHDPDAPPADPGTRGRRTVPGDAAKESVPTHGLRAILRGLIRDPSYRTSTDQLVLPGRDKDYTHQVRRVCVRTIDVADDHVSTPRRRLYWGEIRWAAAAAGTYWLNSERWDTLTVQLPPEATAELLRFHRLGDVEDLIGARFIVYGWLNQKDDRLFVHVREPEWFDIRLPSEDPAIA